MSEFKGTKEMNILGSNEIGFGIGYRNNVKLSVWGNDKEAKANALLISKAPEILEMLQWFVENFEGVFHEGTETDNKVNEAKQLIKQATDL